jgi:hypothetical protein
MSRTARGIGPVIDESSVLQFREKPLAEVELVGNHLIGLTGEHVLEPAPMQNGFADEIEQTVDLLGRDTDRGAPVGPSRLGFGCWLGLRRLFDVDVGCEAEPPLFELGEQIPDTVTFTGKLPADRIDRAEQGVDEV